MVDSLDTIKLQVLPDSLCQGASGSISGVIYLEANSRAFPEATWNDLVIPILKAWVRTTIDILNQRTKEGSVYFMDGPFHVDIHRVDGSRLNVRLSDDRRGGSPIQHYTGSDRDFSITVLQATDQVTSECRRQGWQSPEIEELRRLRTELKAALES